VQLTIVILNISFIVGMFWIILCQAVEDFIHDTDFRLIVADEGHDDKYGD